MELSRCQTEDAYIKTGQATVVDVLPGGEHVDVLLDQTVFYPEGGGQPADRGTIDGVAVEDVFRNDGGAVVHRLAAPLDEGTEVDLRVDWSRRFDFMQQHTAQHLITAIADDEFDLATTSFHLGREYSAIEFDREDVSRATFSALQARVNEETRRARPVRFRFVDRDALEEQEIRARRLPAGLGERVRLIEIEGIDLNMCGGTHVRSTAELQTIKFMGGEAARGGTRLSFLAGGRVLRWIQDELDRQSALNELLSCGPEDYVDVVSNTLENAREAERALRNAREELSERIGVSAPSGDGLVVLHRDEQDFKFLESVASTALERSDVEVVFLTASSESAGDGLFLLAGPPDFVASAGAELADILEGRGGGRPGRYQGRANAIQRRDRAVDYLEVARAS